MFKSMFTSLLCFAALFCVTGCEDDGLVTSPAPAPRTELAGPVAHPRTELSLALQSRLAAAQAEQLTYGLLRRDGGGPDARFSRDDLVENFLRVAMYHEYAMQGGRMVARQTASNLRRFNQPVRMSVHFGSAVPLSQRVQDQSDITRYTRRLARATGHPISMQRENANFLVLVLNEDERQSWHGRMRQLLPTVSDRDIASVLSMSANIQCHVYAWDPQNNGSYSRAVAVVRAEHPDLTRLSCFHEELAQGLGLANDSPDARPSIFNDDEEFAMLTHHDEMLLKILYDPRLETGMTLAEVRPVVEIIASEMMGGS